MDKKEKRGASGTYRRFHNYKLLIIIICKPDIVFYNLLSRFHAAGSGSRQLPAGDSPRDYTELFKIANAFGMETENFGTVTELRENLHKHIKERRQESRKASIIQSGGICGTVYV